MANASWTEINNWLDNVAKDLRMDIRRSSMEDLQKDGNEWEVCGYVRCNPRQGYAAYGRSLQEALTKFKANIHLEE